MIRPLLISGGRIIDPEYNVDFTGDLLLVEGKIEWVGQEGSAPAPQGAEVLSAQGRIVCPGFIDLHCHLREPGFERKETIASGTRAAAKGGFATVCCMPNTNPPLDSPEAVEYVKAKARSEATVRLLPIGCITKRREGELLADMEELARAGVVGFSDDGDPVMKSDLLRLALQRGCDLGIPIIEHCEDTSLTKGGCINEGKVAGRLGLVGMPSAAEESMVDRDLRLAKDTGAWLHITHVSTARSVDLIRQAKADGINVTADITPHHLTLTEERVTTHGSMAKVNPPLRTQADVEALIQGLRDDTIDAIATDHAPHTAADKGDDLVAAAFGISGLETALGVLMKLVHGGRIDLATLLSKLTSEPAKVLSRKVDRHLGTLAVGSPGDVTIFDPEAAWTVDPKDFVSKGKNTPWSGCVLKGKVMMTIADGKVIFMDSAMIHPTQLNPM